MKKLHGFWVLAPRAPQGLGQAYLSQADLGQDDLTDGHITAGKLADPYQEGAGKLGQDSEAENELAEAEEQTHPELGHRDDPKGKLADGDDPLGYPQFALGVFTEGHVNQGIAIKCSG